MGPEAACLEEAWFKIYMQRFLLEINAGDVICRIQETQASTWGHFQLEGKRERIDELAERLRERETALDPSELRELGELLFDALFNGSVLNKFLNSYFQTSKTTSEILRLELCFIDPASDAAALPWEFLCIPRNRAVQYGIGHLEPFLAISGRVTLVRSVINVSPRTTARLAPREKLRVGLVVSKPRIWEDLPELGEIDDQPILDLLENLSQEKDAASGFEHQLQNPATKGTIKELLVQYRPHILHYVGHGDVLDKDPVLILVDDQTKETEEFYEAEPVPGVELEKLFTEYCPTVVVLQSCNTAKTGDLSSHPSMAAQLAQAGIPLVIAMQYEIQNDVAAKFVKKLYTDLATSRNSLEKAVNAARQELYIQNKINRDFGTAVIYVTTTDSRLFPRSIEQADFDQLVTEFLAMPGLDSISTDLINTIAELCFNNTITYLQPLRGRNFDLKSWVNHLVEASPTRDNSPLPFAYFVATLSDQVFIDNRPLSEELKKWSLQNAEKLKIDPDYWDVLILPDPSEQDSPCLQLIITESKKNQPDQDDKTKKFELVARDGREGIELERPAGSPTEFTLVELKPYAQAYISMIRDRLKPNEREKWRQLLWIEFCLPDMHLSRKVEQWAVKKESQEKIGECCKVVVRSLYRWEERYGKLENTWPHKWKACENAMNNLRTLVKGIILTSSAYEPSELEEKFKAAQVLGLTFDPTQATLLPNLLDSGIPIVIWARGNTDTNAVEHWLKEKISLDKSPDLRHLAEFVRQERKSQTPLSESLVLLWDNFNRQLPTQPRFIDPSEFEDGDTPW